MSENKKKLPFKIIRSDVSGGYSDTLHQQFTGGVDLVNYHKDTYGEFQDNPLQSPFTAQWVGGHQFRHVNINEGNDNASNRPEGWHTEFKTIYGTVVDEYSSYEKIYSSSLYITSNESIEFGGTLYQFLGFAESGSNTGRIGYITSTDGASWSDITFPDELVGEGTSDKYASNLSCIIYNNKMWLFSAAPLSGSSNQGAVYYHTSSNGNDWSERILVSTTSDSDSFLGSDIKAIADEERGKIHLFIGVPMQSVAAFNDPRVIYLYTENEGQYWNSNIISSTPYISNNGGDRGVLFGVSLDAIKNTDGKISVFFSDPSYDTSSVDNGILYVVTSSTDGIFSYPTNRTTLLTGSFPESNIGGSLVKAVELNEKTYCFFGDTGKPFPYKGSLYVISSSENNTWNPSDYTGIDKSIELFTGSTSSDNVTGVDNLSSNYSTYLTFRNYRNIFDSIVKNNHIYWILGSSFAHSIDGSITDSGIVIVGKTEDGLNWNIQKEYTGSTNQYIGSRVNFIPHDEDKHILYCFSDFSSNFYDLYFASGSYLPIEKVLNVYSHGYLNSPPAYLTRDGLAKRPVNTRNIKGANSPIGNFFNNYEVVQTSGRRITNNLIVDGFVAGGELTTQFITGSHNYSLPVLNPESGSKSIIVERFNAPGSKEESSRGALDREGEEMSPNISLPWRNYKIRKPFYSQLSQSTPQGGGSIHGVNRNTVIRAGNTLVDNGFLVRSLPGTDIQYSWITASSETSASELGGYQSFNGSYGLGEAYSDIEFISGSYVFVDGQEEFVDNYGLYSFVKDKKSVDLDTKTLSITEVGTSASYGEITNSPYTFTTWTSIRTGETLVARALRKNNIISYQDPNNEQVSKNYTDPVVTFKYKPLNTKLGLRDAPEGLAYNLTHTYTNNISSFANKNLIVDFNLSEDKEQFYDFLFNLYTDFTVPNNPVTSFGGYSYREIIWPREEYTGLDETRKRKAYYLDKPGYDRDGFDRQLGTQRVFWRDNQEDRKRSLNSVGGYSSSFGYISTEESGSSFSVNGPTILLDDSEYIYTSSFSQSTNLDSGIFNSISLMEYTPHTWTNSYEKLIFTSSFEIMSQSNDLLTFDEQINISYKRGYKFNIAGEFNHAFVDFYGVSKISGSNILRDLGAVYRTSLYKSQLTTKQYDFNSSQDNKDTISLIKTEDDEIRLNPKLRYTAFVGGGILNTGAFVQYYFRDSIPPPWSREYKYTHISSSYEGYGATVKMPKTKNLALVTSKDETYPYLKSKPLLHILGDTAAFEITSSLPFSENLGQYGLHGLIAFDYSGSYFAVADTSYPSNNPSTSYGRVHIYKMNSNNTFYEFDNFTGSVVTNFFKDMDLYVDQNENIYCLVGNNDAGNGNALLFHRSPTGTKTETIITPSTSDSKFGNKVKIFDENRYIISAYGTITSTTEKIHIYENGNVTTFAPTTNWRKYGIALDCNKDFTRIYVGAPVESSPGQYWGKVYVYESGSSGWLEIDSITGSNPASASLGEFFGTSLSLHEEEQFLLVGAPQRSLSEDPINARGSCYIFQTSSAGWILNSDYEKSILDGNDLVITGSRLGESVAINNAQNIVIGAPAQINGIEQTGSVIYYEKTDGKYIPNNFFDTYSGESEIFFSTLDNGLQRTTEIDSGKKPFFDSYDDYLSDVRGLSKEYSVLPEFKISDHIRYYVEEKGENFISQNRKFLSIDGVSGSYQSATTEEATTIDNNFYKTYVTSDLLKKHDEIRTENSEFSELASITVKLEGIKKLLPYNGFYPQDRITQIANLYEEYVDDNLAGGVLNVSYEDTQRNVTLVSNHPESTASLGAVNASSIAEFDGKYYLAVGYHYYNSNQGLVKIFSSSTGELLDSANWSQNSLATYIGDTTGVDFGNSVKLVSGSNGLNLFVSEYGTLKDGAVYQITSSDGSSWSEKTRISSSATVFLSSSANSYFGNQIDAIYDDSNGKFVLSVGSHQDPINGTKSGAVYIVTSSNGNSWSQKILAAQGLSNTWLGTSVSLVSSSNSNYYLYASAPFKDANSLTDAGVIYVFSSTNDGETWTGTVTSDTSSVPAIITGSQATTYMGFGGIKAVEHGSRHYVFYAEPYSDLNETNTGNAFVVYSSPNVDWSSTRTKIKLATGPFSGDALTRYFAHYKSISAVSSSDGLLYYSFSAINGDSENGTNTGRVYLGNSTDGVSFQQDEQITQVVGELPSSFIGGSVSMIMSGTTAVSMYTDKQKLNGLTAGKQLALNLIVSGSEVEKTWKHAAIEPLFGPGIMYNTIKSGLAVDWPCATGSTAVTTLDSGVVINPFYPQAKIMSSFQGDNGFYNLQGSLKSKINYRIPFENIIDPRDMFESKTVLTSNIKETYKVGTEIPENSEISQFISGTYVYGGYEPYVNPSDVNDIYGQTAKRFSVPFVYQKETARFSNLYTRAMNNFLAESVKFFLKEEKLTAFVSKPDSEWGNFEQNSVYYMDIEIDKSEDLVMMEAWHSDKHPIGPNGEKMNGRYFGYPVNKTTKELWTGEEFTSEESKLIFNDPAYAPYTPPYFEGKAIVRLEVMTDTPGPLSVQDLFDNLSISDQFPAAARGWQEGSDAQLNKMPVGSSLDIFGVANSREVTVIRESSDGRATGIQEKEVIESKVWVIGPRFETPVLDFSNQDLVSSNSSYLWTGGFGRGMWSGYGSIPTNNKGIEVRLTYPQFNQDTSPYPYGTNRNYYNLLEKVGFSEKVKKIGKIAEQKEISEGVVLIPYVDSPLLGTNYIPSIKKYVFVINKDVYNTQFENVQNGRSAVQAGQLNTGEDIENTSISDLIKTAQKYVLPPELDFINQSGVLPFVMYMFEVKHLLEQQDLADIWQGLMPEISRTAEEIGRNIGVKDKNIISHPSSPYEFFHGKPLPPNLKWMVFKVKKKGEIDYGKVTQSSRDDENFISTISIGNEGAKYSYNWPYDFFSLVELGKIEVDLEYSRKVEFRAVSAVRPFNTEE